jgi:cobalamin biosynthetic protein CobC
MIQASGFHHGGQLDRVKQDYPEQLLPWIDLSTGISPFRYPVDINASACFKHLPQGHSDLIAAASCYYGVDHGLPIPGSMWAIQNLPLIRKLCEQNTNDSRPVLLPRMGFNEHVKAWAAWGFNIEYYDDMPSIDQLGRAQSCVVINPNNPTGYHCSKQSLLDAHKLLLSNDAWLIVDEAFIDLTPEYSCVAESVQQGFIVLRSFGKYFGLPGIRLGSIMACDQIIGNVKNLLNEWSINSAAQQIATTAFLDANWQYEVNKNIKTNSVKLQKLLKSLDLKTQGTDFFRTYLTSNAKILNEHLLKLGIYVRLLDDESGIRIGMPNENSDWKRLEVALSSFNEHKPLDLNTH